MKITSKEILDTLGIKVGDEIVVNGDKYKLIIDHKGNYIFVDKNAFKLLVEDLIDLEFEHIKHKKKVGETLCGNYMCHYCPLRLLASCPAVDKLTLYETLDQVIDKKLISKDNPIYLAFRAELDKEVDHCA